MRKEKGGSNAVPAPTGPTTELDVRRSGFVMKKWFSVLGWILIGGLLLAVPIGFHYLDRWGAEACTRSGKALVNRKEYAQAIDHFNRAIEVDPTYAPAYDGRGVAYLNQGEQDRAIVDLSEAIRLDPSDARAQYHRGVAYSRSGDYDRALADFGEAIRLSPGSANAYLARSWVYAKKGDDAQAKADRQKAVELDPALEKSEEGNP